MTRHRASPLPHCVVVLSCCSRTHAASPTSHTTWPGVVVVQGDDIYLKRYATALIKRQWGANLSKFQGVQLLGGVEMNGAEIYSQAQEEILRLEEQIMLAFETPIDYMVG